MITITDVNDYEVTKSTSNEISIERNRIKPMAAFKVETVETIPNNQIWYTSSDGNVITPKTGVFSVNITSNVYENGKGIITFDNSVTTIGDYAFSYRESLKTITIPNSVTNIGNSAFTGCSSLSNIEIPDNVKAIGEYTFMHCSSLTNVTISIALRILAMSE